MEQGGGGQTTPLGKVGNVEIQLDLKLTSDCLCIVWGLLWAEHWMRGLGHSKQCNRSVAICP